MTREFDGDAYDPPFDCDDCGNTGLIEWCDADGGNPYETRCVCEHGERIYQANPRERYEDDGTEYGHPGDFMNGLED